MPPASPRARAPYLALAAGLILVLWFYGWTDSTNAHPAAVNGQQGDYYSLLVHGLLHGHTWLDVPVSPALAAAPDPYAPAVWRAHGGLPDASFYQGHYYLYFGVVPAVLLLLPWHLLTGSDLSLAAAVNVTAVLGFLSLVVMWWRIRRRWFPEASALVTFFAVLVFGLGSGLLTSVRRPGIWDLPIVAGALFVSLLLHCLLSAILSPRKTLWLALAGLALGLAVGSRPTQMGAVFAPLAFLAAWYAGQRREAAPGANAALSSPVSASTHAWRRGVAAFAGGFAIVVALLAWYNFARFGNPLEFGFTYQLSDPSHVHGGSFHAGFIPANFRLYYFGGLTWSRSFPFVAMGPPGALPAGHYAIETLYGLAFYAPVIWFALAVPLAWSRRPGADDPGLSALRTLAGALALAWLGPGVIDLCFAGATWRYVADFMPPLLLLGVMGVAALETRVIQPVRRAVLVTAWTATALVTAGVASLLSLQLWNQIPLGRGPLYYRDLARTLNTPVAWLDEKLGHHYGPVRFNQVVLPAGHSAGPEKLLESSGTTLLIDYPAAGAVRFGILYNGEHEPHWGAAFSPAAADPHTITATFGSLLPGLDHPYWRTHAFQAIERSQVAVEFDGRRLLDEFHTLAAGDSRTIHLAGEAPSGPGWFTGRIGGAERGASVDPASLLAQFEPWRLSLRTPASPGRWPLLSSGDAARGDALFLDQTAEGTATLGYFHHGAPLQHSAPFALKPGTPLELEVTLEQLSPLGRQSGGVGPLLVERNGRVLWATRAPFFRSAASTLLLGENVAAAPDCAANFPSAIERLPSLPRPDPTPANDRLLLKVVFPERPVGGLREPLLAYGTGDASATVFVRYYGGGVLRFELAGAHALTAEGAVLSGVDSAWPHAIEIARESVSSNSIQSGQAAADLVLRIDGVEALRAPVGSVSPATAAQIGTAPVQMTSDAPAFSGEILLKRWVTPVN